MAHPLSSYLGFSDLYAALVADDTLVSYLLIFAAVALPVLRRSEDPFTEKAVLLRLEGPVIYSLGFRNLSVRPAEDLFSGRQPD